MYLAKFIEQSVATIDTEIYEDLVGVISGYVNEGGIVVLDRVKSAILRALNDHERVGTNVTGMVSPRFGLYADYSFQWDINHNKVPVPDDGVTSIAGLINTRLVASDFKGIIRTLNSTCTAMAVLYAMISLCTTGTREHFRQNCEKGAFRVGYYNTEFLVNVAGDVLHTYKEFNQKSPYDTDFGTLYRDRLSKLNVNTVIDLDELYLYTLIQHLQQKQTD